MTKEEEEDSSWNLLEAYFEICYIYKTVCKFSTMSEGSGNVQLEHQESHEALDLGEHGDTVSEGLQGSDSPQSSPHKTDKHKIDILLKATGNAPIMKKKKWAVDQERQIGWIIEFIKKYLKLDPSESLFLYVNQAFAPSPDQIVKNLYECYGTDGKLVLHYCKSQAWG